MHLVLGIISWLCMMLFVGASAAFIHTIYYTIMKLLIDTNTVSDACDSFDVLGVTIPRAFVKPFSANPDAEYIVSKVYASDSADKFSTVLINPAGVEVQAWLGLRVKDGGFSVSDLFAVSPCATTFSPHC